MIRSKHSYATSERSGPDGCAESIEVDLGEGVTLIRPLLEVSRSSARLLHPLQPEFRTDSSNASPDFTQPSAPRLVPLLRAFNPRFDEAVARAATLLAEDEGTWSVRQQQSSKILRAG
jgi:tRNA(Ile)-lysidine synthase TilS/MesJ